MQAMVRRVRRLVALVALVALALPARAAGVDPSADGPYAVGVTTVTFMDASRSRTLVTEVWYPARSAGRDALARRRRGRAREPRRPGPDHRGGARSRRRERAGAGLPRAPAAARRAGRRRHGGHDRALRPGPGPALRGPAGARVPGEDRRRDAQRLHRHGQPSLGRAARAAAGADAAVRDRVPRAVSGARS